MRIEIEEGELICECTGKPVSALARIKPMKELGSQYDGIALSREVLRKALALLDAFEGAQPTAFPVVSTGHVQTQTYVPPVPAYALSPVGAEPESFLPVEAPAPRVARPAAPAISDNDKRVGSQVAAELVALCKKHGDTEEGKKGGVPETEIKDVIKRYWMVFQEPKKNLFVACNQIVGMDKDRFDFHCRSLGLA